jgi:4-alpha-glucanotransferase
MRLDHQLPSLGPGRLVAEDGSSTRLGPGRPPDLQPGYHWFEPDDGPAHQLVVSPGRVPLPPREMWGFSAQLYATRSRASWGIGDLDDLRRLGEWSSALGAGLVLINPLHACTPTFPQQPSPYFAGSRCFMNPIYIAVGRVPGSAEVEGMSDLVARGESFNSDRLIDRDRVWLLKSRALEAIFGDFGGHADFDRFCQERGRPLEQFAAFCALAERHGREWRSWSSELRHPDSAGVRAFMASETGRQRVRYHSWLQWILDAQATEAGDQIGVVQDLAVGVDPSGPDSWIWQDDFAPGMRIGAPPDEFNTQGQDWGLPPFDPWKLRASGYRPWIAALRAGFRHGSGLRVDHVMGLFRLYWIPDGAEPAAGGYVRYPHHDMLNLLALEAHRAGAFVVGEDLGTVEDEVRSDLAARRVLSYRVWWFESEPCSAWPVQAMGAVTTHDLPTVAGVWTGSDLEAQQKLGLEPNEEASVRLRRKLVERTGCPIDTGSDEVIGEVYADLSEAPCLLLSAALDDALAVEERPNLPGTVDEWPNWRLALPVPLEDLETAALARRIAGRLSHP